MRLLLYRTLPENQQLPADQRWAVIELEPGEPADPAAAIKRHSASIPVGVKVVYVDTDTLDSWTPALAVTKDKK